MCILCAQTVTLSPPLFSSCKRSPNEVDGLCPPFSLRISNRTWEEPIFHLVRPWDSRASNECFPFALVAGRINRQTSRRPLTRLAVLHFVLSHYSEFSDFYLSLSLSLSLSHLSHSLSHALSLLWCLVCLSAASCVLSALSS
jgi:hypothetical protein